jgi:hypothetical protein
MPLLLRIAKRMAVWERNDLQEIIETEFEETTGLPDLKPSVYEIESPGLALRTFTEHAASARLDPPRSGRVIDFGNPPNTKTLGTSYFQFTREGHRELGFKNTEELREFLTAVIKNPEARYPIEKGAALAYARDRIAAEDPEWLSYCTDYVPKSKKWGCT